MAVSSRKIRINVRLLLVLVTTTLTGLVLFLAIFLARDAIDSRNQARYFLEANHMVNGIHEMDRALGGEVAHGMLLMVSNRETRAAILPTLKELQSRNDQLVNATLDQIAVHALANDNQVAVTLTERCRNQYLELQTLRSALVSQRGLHQDTWVESFSSLFHLFRLLRSNITPGTNARATPVAPNLTYARRLGPTLRNHRPRGHAVDVGHGRRRGFWQREHGPTHATFDANSRVGRP